jgi:HK97 family phage prohead protease
MAYKFVDQRRFRELASLGDAAGAAVERLGSVARAADDDSRVVTFVFSDGTVDRMGDVIDPYGWDTSAFKKNPICLWAHDATSPPIGKVQRTYVSADRFMGDIEFASAETFPFADQIYRLVVDGFVKAVSVGFTPIEWDWADSKERPTGIDFKRQELLEISVVPIPANANALIEARAKSWRRGSAVLAERASPAPSVFSYAGTLQDRKNQLHHDHPGLAPSAQIECQIRAMTHIGPPDTPSGRREWIDTLRRLHRRALR